MTVKFKQYEVGETGLGLMTFTVEAVQKVDHDKAIETMKVAVEKGATMWNGGEFYGQPDPEENLQLIRKYFEKYPEDASKVHLSVKGGMNLEKMCPDGSEENIDKSIKSIMKYLDGVKKLDMYCLARVDTNIGIEVSARAIKKYIDQGKIGGWCLSECSGETIRKAQNISPLDAVEIEYSLWSRNAETNGTFAACVEHDIAVIAYSPLGHGYFTGHFKKASDLTEGRIQGIFDRFKPENMSANMPLVEKVEQVATKIGAKPGQVALEWIRQKSRSSAAFPLIIPIPGTKSLERVIENTQRIPMTEENVKEIDEFLAGFEVKGLRYNKMSESHLEL